MICVSLFQFTKSCEQTLGESVHPTFANMSEANKRAIVNKSHLDKKSSQDKMNTYLRPQNFINLVPVKLAFILAQHKMPFSNCEVFMKCAAAADPNSEVFRKL